MAKHKPMCLVMTLLLVVGGVNWGLVGLGWLMGNPNLNLVHMILGSLPMQVEAVVYLLVGVSALMMGYFALTCKECPCAKK